MTRRSGAPRAAATAGEALRATLAELRADVERLRSYGVDSNAITLEYAITRMETAIRESETATLTLEQAAAELGYSRDTLRHLISDGKIPNRGKKGAPRVRRADVPNKPARRVSSGYDPRADAIQLLNRQGGSG